MSKLTRVVQGACGLCFCASLGCSSKPAGDGEAHVAAASQAIGAVGAPLFVLNPSSPGVYGQGFARSLQISPYQLGGAVAAGDVNNDGLDDVIGGFPGPFDMGSVGVFNEFSTRIDVSGLSPFTYQTGDVLAAGDVNKDGFDEIIFGHGATFQPYTQEAIPGDLSIIARNGTTVGNYLPNNGSQLFPFQGQVVVCDLNHDGFDDIIVAPSFTIYTHPSLPADTFAHYFNAPVPFNPLADKLACADVNGDGFADLIVARPSESAFQIITDPSRPAIAPFSTYGKIAFQQGDALAAGDLDGDGSAEFVVGSQGGAISILSANGKPFDTNSFFRFGVSGFGAGDALAVGRHTGNVGLDSDDDGLLDIWETEGIDFDGDGCIDLDLPALGADPLRKDIFVEIDAMGCGMAGGDCATGDGHAHLPTAANLQAVVDAFNNAPVLNPGGSTNGINLHLQIDELAPHQSPCSLGPCFDNIKKTFFGTAAERAGNNGSAKCTSTPQAILGAKSSAFHYSLWGHSQAGASSGISEFKGNDLLITLAGFSGLPNGSAADQAATFMHELGHNLGLDHGGDSSLNYKPNYQSVMNYAFQLSGLIPLNYSTKVLPDLFEIGGPNPALNETLGIQGNAAIQTTFMCPNLQMAPGAGTGPIDWNCNGASSDLGVVSDINQDRFCINPDKNGVLHSAPGGDDFVAGGSIAAGPNGKLDSLLIGNGVQLDDQIVGQTIVAGPNGVLNTSVAVGSDDMLVNHIDAGPNGRVDTIAQLDDVTIRFVSAGANGKLETTRAGDDLIVGTTIQAGLNQTIDSVPPAGSDDQVLSLQILPGSNLVLDSTIAPGSDDLLTPDRINPGPDGSLDSDVNSKGLQKDDQVVGGQVVPGNDGILQTAPARDDILSGEVIVDGNNRTCESLLAAGDTITRNSITRPIGSTEPAQLKGFEDWSHLFYQFRGSEDFAEGSHANVSLETQTAADVQQQRQALTVADVAVSASASASPIAPGVPFTYHVVVSNSGPGAAVNPTINLALPATAHVVSCSTGAGSCGELIAAGFASLGAGQTASADFTVIADCGAAGASLAATFSVVATSFDSSPANSRVTLQTPLAQAAPVFTSVPPGLTVSQCHAPALGAATSKGACGGSVTVTNNAPATFPLGVTTVTWRATNQVGASTTATQAVTVLLGNDSSCCPAGTHIIVGTPNNDVISGTSGADCILGLGGQDTINGNAGNDIISGGDGDDIIDGGDGDDRLYGGTGQDRVSGGNGADTIDGGDGDDTCHGGPGNDYLTGGQGQDLLTGDDDNDRLLGQQGTDNLQGGAGDDYLEGGGQADTCTGSTGTNLFVSCANRPDAPTAPDACSDLVRDAQETSVDCGGSGCAPCEGGPACSVGSDCQSGVCASGVCTAPTRPIGASLIVNTDWGAGYCATIQVRNFGSTPTRNWSVLINTNQATISSINSGASDVSSGSVTFSPLSGPNRAVPAGGTNSAVTFCANRNVLTTPVATVLDETATY